VNVTSGGKTKRTVATTSIAPLKRKSGMSFSRGLSTTTAKTPGRVKRKAKVDQDTSSSESESDEVEKEDEEKEEEEEPQPKRGRLNLPIPSRREISRPRPSTVSTLSELTQDWDEEDQEPMEKESDENDFGSPVKKSRNDISISSPIHQLAEEEDVNDRHWGRPSAGVKKPYQSDPALGLHLEDFGTGTIPESFV
jgi:hypothetical protein